VRHVCDGLAASDLTPTTGLTSNDEPGQMGRSLDDAMVKLRAAVATVDSSASSPADATEQMTGTAHQIAASVSAAADEISRSVSTVSSDSAQMGASIRESPRTPPKRPAQPTKPSKSPQPPWADSANHRRRSATSSRPSPRSPNRLPR
jgi:hypothetical protein